MAKSIIQARTGPADRECFLCREEAERNGYYGELCHTGLHKHHGVRYGICSMSGNLVYLDPWKEQKACGSGWIHHHVSSCALYEKKEENSQS